MQKAWQARTFVDFGRASPGQHLGSERGGSIRRAALAWGLAQSGREAFCVWRPLEAVKPWQARTFAVAELAPSMTLKSYCVHKPATLKVMHIMAPLGIKFWKPENECVCEKPSP